MEEVLPNIREETLIKMEGIEKRFQNVIANKKVNFELFKGEIHALLGGNGAGKSTLMKILAGFSKPDAGSIYFKGKKVLINSPKEARKLGIILIPQAFLLVESFKVVEAVALSMNKGVKEANKKMEEIKRKYNFFVDPEKRILELSEGEKQKLEIIKAICTQKNEVIIFDEPTSLFTQEETQQLVKLIKKLKEEGKSIVFITHKLDEVFEVADRVSVMRNGEIVATKRVKETNKDQLAKLIVGGEGKFFEFLPRETKEGKKVLEIEGLKVKTNKNFELNNINFFVKEYEIFGVFGMAGNGQDELAETIIGLRKPLEGRILFEKEDLKNATIEERLKKGIVYIPDERLKSIFPNFSISENLIIKHVIVNDKEVCNNGLLKIREINSFTEELKKDFNIFAPNIKTRARELSGGNIQKLILAQNLSLKPKLIVACNPTHGLDIGATKDIRNILINERNKGSAILLISQDIDEVFEMSDRVAIINTGRIVKIDKPQEFTKEEIGKLITTKIKMKEF
ncbi:MAG: ABC transporter ATP-binding protein [Candidatus Micrarchaeia archaeon]|jgi:simple sugar transport system ATP-binding protein